MLRTRILLAGVCAVGVAGSAAGLSSVFQGPAAVAAAPREASAAASKDIVDTAVAAGQFKTLAAALKDKKPGDTLQIEVRRPTGMVVKTTMTLAEDPSLVAAPVETPTPEQKAFRDAWLGPKAK